MAGECEIKGDADDPTQRGQNMMDHTPEEERRYTM